MDDIDILDYIDILYEDNHVICAVKPPGILSQADSTGDSDMLSLLKRYIKARYGKPGNVYLGLVHRLDRPVGGIMAFARTSKAAARLSEQIRERRVRKTYIAAVRGATPLGAPVRLEHIITKDAGANMVTVRNCPGGAPGMGPFSAPGGAERRDGSGEQDMNSLGASGGAGRRDVGGRRMSGDSGAGARRGGAPGAGLPDSALSGAAPSNAILSGGDPRGAALPENVAALVYETLEYAAADDMSLVEISLITGRPHQIRAQFAFVGHPVAGDRKYGRDGGYRASRDSGCRTGRDGAGGTGAGRGGNESRDVRGCMEHGRSEEGAGRGGSERDGSERGAGRGFLERNCTERGGSIAGVAQRGLGAAGRSGAAFIARERQPLQWPALWAARLEFEHPAKREIVSLRSAPPPELPWTLFGAAADALRSDPQ